MTAEPVAPLLSCTVTVIAYVPLTGVTQEVKDITILLNNENVIKRGCERFKTLLGVMATFGGEEVIQF